jgi:hypothetical protein
MLPMSRGGEAGWSRFVGTDGAGPTRRRRRAAGLAPLILGTAVRLRQFSMADVRAVRAATSRDGTRPRTRPRRVLRERRQAAAVARRERPGPEPGRHQRLRARGARGRSAARAQLRYFLLPGTEHCGGGPGASRVAWLDTLENWDEAAARRRGARRRPGRWSARTAPGRTSRATAATATPTIRELAVRAARLVIALRGEAAPRFRRRRRPRRPACGRGCGGCGGSRTRRRRPTRPARSKRR